VQFSNSKEKQEKLLYNCATASVFLGQLDSFRQESDTRAMETEAAATLFISTERLQTNVLLVSSYGLCSHPAAGIIAAREGGSSLVLSARPLAYPFTQGAHTHTHTQHKTI